MEEVVKLCSRLQHETNSAAQDLRELTQVRKLLILHLLARAQNSFLQSKSFLDFYYIILRYLTKDAI